MVGHWMGSSCIEQVDLMSELCLLSRSELVSVSALPRVHDLGQWLSSMDMLCLGRLHLATVHVHDLSSCDLVFHL